MDIDREIRMMKLAWADDLGRQMAHADMEKLALAGIVPGGVMSNVRHIGGSLLNTSQLGKGVRSAVGAGYGGIAGAGLGAAKGLIAPGQDAQGNQRGRLGAMAGGALKGGVGGAALGAGAGLASKGVVRSMAAGNTGRGSGMRNLMQGAIDNSKKMTGVTNHPILNQMQKNVTTLNRTANVANMRSGNANMAAYI